MRTLVATCPVDVCSGYGSTACSKILGLLKRGHQVLVRSTATYDIRVAPVPFQIQERLIGGRAEGPDWEWELIIQPPDFVPPEGKRLVWYTTLESTGLAPEAVGGLNKAEAIVVPSQWNKDSLLALGVKPPIHACPEELDNVFTFRPMKAPGGPFVFGTAGNVTPDDGGRKGIRDVIRAFCAAFPNDPDVRLSIKTNYELIAHDSRIEVVSDMLSHAALADWYGSLDVFVSASRGEGFGRMLCEAMAVGRPCIAMNFGGHKEFFSEDCGWDVFFLQKPGEGRYKIGRWAVPDMDDLVASMEEARTSPDLAAMGQRANERALAVTKDAADKFERILVGVGALL